MSCLAWGVWSTFPAGPINVGAKDGAIPFISLAGPRDAVHLNLDFRPRRSHREVLAEKIHPVVVDGVLGYA